jgi:hypothetical protein
MMLKYVISRAANENRDIYATENGELFTQPINPSLWRQFVNWLHDYTRISSTEDLVDRVIQRKDEIPQAEYQSLLQNVMTIAARFFNPDLEEIKTLKNILFPVTPSGRPDLRELARNFNGVGTFYDYLNKISQPLKHQLDVIASQLDHYNQIFD